jgi:hypothetical protein
MVFETVIEDNVLYFDPNGHETQLKLQLRAFLQTCIPSSLMALAKLQQAKVKSKQR